MKNKMKVVKDENVGKVQVSAFRKEKNLPRHAKSTVKVYGIWKSDAYEKDFMERVVSIYANMSSEYHLHVTSAGDMLTVAAWCLISKTSYEVTFTQYQWHVILERQVEGKQNTAMWSIVGREQLLGGVAWRTIS